MTTPRLRIATRGSALARWQAQHVAQLLRGGAGGRAIEIELVVIETTADRRLDISIEQMGGKGVFVKEIQEAVLDGRADLAVHSAKDLPSVTVDGLVLASITERADPRDVLVGARYDALASGAHIATGAQRNAHQERGDNSQGDADREGCDEADAHFGNGSVDEQQPADDQQRDAANG